MNRLRSTLSSYWRLARARNLVATWILATFFFVAGIAYMRTFDWSMEVTSTDEFCVSCHTMRDNVYPAYIESVHYSNRSGVRAFCADCHVPHRWSDKVVRKVQATKELWGTATGRIDTPEKFAEHRLELAQREWNRFRRNDSLECRNCHDQSFMNFERQGAPGAYMHSAMLEAGSFTCIDCHKGIAHVLPEIENLEALSAAALEPTMRAPFDHRSMTRE